MVFLWYYTVFFLVKITLRSVYQRTEKKNEHFCKRPGGSHGNFIELAALTLPLLFVPATSRLRCTQGPNVIPSTPCSIQGKPLKHYKKIKNVEVCRASRRYKLHM